MDAGRHSDSVTNHLYWHGVAGYEPEVVDVLLPLSRGARVVLDVGANVGVYAMLAAFSNPDARVIAFEPVDDVFERLAANVALNRLSGVVCVRAAVGAARGQIPLYSPIGRIDTIASTSVDHWVKWAPGPWRCDLAEVISLDDFAEEAKLPGVDLVKIDVEQQEHAVLQGMQGLLSNQRPHIVCEVLPHGPGGSDRARHMDELLRPHGYHIYLLRPHGPMLRQRVSGDYDHWNQLFTMLDPPALAAAIDGSRLTVS